MTILPTSFILLLMSPVASSVAIDLARSGLISARRTHLATLLSENPRVSPFLLPIPNPEQRRQEKKNNKNKATRGGGGRQEKQKSNDQNKKKSHNHFAPPSFSALNRVFREWVYISRRVAGLLLIHKAIAAV